MGCHMRSLVPSALALVSVSCAYQPGSFHGDEQQFLGARTTVQCLDVAIDRRPNLATGQAVVTYAFGNRCDHATLVDLSGVSVVARDADGNAFTLRAFDPRHELEPLELDGRAIGNEAIAYVGAGPQSTVCVDAASIAHVAPAQWRCFPAPTEVP
jgi:hypothetical protein